MTCRADKPRGRKAKEKNIKSGAKKHGRSGKSKNIDYRKTMILNVLSVASCSAKVGPKNSGFNACSAVVGALHMQQW